MLKEVLSTPRRLTRVVEHQFAKHQVGMALEQKIVDKLTKPNITEKDYPIDPDLIEERDNIITHFENGSVKIGKPVVEECTDQVVFPSREVFLQ